MTGTNTNGKVPKSEADLKVVTSNNRLTLSDENHLTNWSFLNTPLGRWLRKFNPLRSLSKEEISEISKKERSNNNLFKNCLLWLGGVHWNCDDLTKEAADKRVPKAILSIIVSLWDGGIIGTAAAYAFGFSILGGAVGVGIIVGELAYNKTVFSKPQLSKRDIVIRLIPGIAIALMTSVFMPVFLSRRTIQENQIAEIEEEIKLKEKQIEELTPKKHIVDLDRTTAENKAFKENPQVVSLLGTQEKQLDKLETELLQIRDGSVAADSLAMEEQVKILFLSMFVSELDKERASFYLQKTSEKHNTDSKNANIDRRYPLEELAYKKVNEASFYRFWTLFWFFITISFESVPMLIQLKMKDEQADSHETRCKYRESAESLLAISEYDKIKAREANESIETKRQYLKNLEVLTNFKVLEKRFEQAQEDGNFVGTEAEYLEKQHNYSSSPSNSSSSSIDEDSTDTLDSDQDRTEQPLTEGNESLLLNFDRDDDGSEIFPTEDSQQSSLHQQLNKWISSDNRDDENDVNKDPWK